MTERDTEFREHGPGPDALSKLQAWDATLHPRSPGIEPRIPSGTGATADARADRFGEFSAAMEALRALEAVEGRQRASAASGALRAVYVASGADTRRNREAMSALARSLAPKQRRSEWKRSTDKLAPLRWLVRVVSADLERFEAELAARS